MQLEIEAALATSVKSEATGIGGSALPTGSYLNWVLGSKK